MIRAARRAIRVACKSVGMIVLVLAVVPSQLLVLAVTRGPASLHLPALFHRLACRVLGIRVESSGSPARAVQAVFLSNHLSHLDVLAIGGIVRACFVAKDDVRGWPVFGALSRLQQTVFITRDPRRVGDAVATIRRALADGHRLVLFPEGTTSDGRVVLPFKSSSFAVLADPSMQDVLLQPLTVELLAVDGRLVADGGNRDHYAYYGSMTLLPHLLAFMATRGARVRLRFHEPLQRVDGQSRKHLAAAAHAWVSKPLMALAGRRFSSTEGISPSPAAGGNAGVPTRAGRLADGRADGWRR